MRKDFVEEPEPEDGIEDNNTMIAIDPCDVDGRILTFLNMLRIFQNILNEENHKTRDSLEVNGDHREDLDDDDTLTVLKLVKISVCAVQIPRAM